MRKTDLCGTWHMTGNGFSCNGKIPGSVYSFLLENKLMEDPYYRINELEALKLSEHEYSFERTFEFSRSCHKTLLHCDGLDTLCSIYINGKFVAATKNMHRTYEFDVSDVLVDGQNSIKLVFSPANIYFKKKQKDEELFSSRDTLCGASHLRKSLCMSGWDWGPRLPDAGIWRSIYLLTADSPRITDFRILQEHCENRVFVTPTAEIEGEEYEVSCTVTSPSGEKFTIPLNEKSEIANPLLWRINGLGTPNLYTFTFEVTQNGKCVDRLEKRIGLRSLKLIRNKDKYGEEFSFEINGIKFFAMGADYIPEDNILSRITRERTYNLLKECRDCNFNMVRVWGGGHYPDDFFYDACDEFGILVFQDLMFACMEVSGDKEMHREIACEVTDNLKRLRHHACMAVISGNNEMEWQLPLEEKKRAEIYLKIFEDLIPEIAKKTAPEIPYVPSSPSTCGHFVDPNNEAFGDSHYWDVWHGGLPFEDYRNHCFRFLSEFGFESFPCEKTVNSFTLPEDRNIFSRTMEMHQRCVGANKKILTYLADTFRYPSNFGTLLYASQLLQAEAMRYCVEHLRRNRGRCMGALYWQLNDIWPVASWASIDYYGRYKALQYAAKRFFAPVIITCKETGEMTGNPSILTEGCYDNYQTKAQLAVSNETLKDVSGEVIWRLCSSEGEIIESGKQSLTAKAMSSVWLGEMDFHRTDVDNNYLYFAFSENGKELSSGTVIFTLPKYFNFQNPKLKCSIDGNKITVSAESFAKYVEVYSETEDMILSDNFFDMEAGSKTVEILSGNPKNIKLRSVYDIK